MKKPNKQNNWFSSDFHLGHANIIKFDGRPFETIEEHDATIINNCKSLIKQEDSFYFLGDFSFNREGCEDYLKQLPGHKFFIKGNHDKKEDIKLFERYGTYLGNLVELEIEEQRIVLCHYKMYSWNKSHRGTWHLYGHSHGHDESCERGKSFDVGINLWGYKPLSFAEVKEIMDKKEPTPL